MISAKSELLYTVPDAKAGENFKTLQDERFNPRSGFKCLKK